MIQNVQPLQTASNIQFIQPIQSRPVFQPLNIVTAQQLTVLPIQTVQPVRNQTISTTDICTTTSSISVPVSKVSMATPSGGVTPIGTPCTTPSKTEPSPAPTPTPVRTPSPQKTISLKSRLTTSPVVTPVVPQIKLIRKDQDKSPGTEKRVLTLKEIPLEEKEAILRGSTPLRTPTPKSVGNSRSTSPPAEPGKDGDEGIKTDENSQKTEPVDDEKSETILSKIKIEPRRQSISLYSKTNSQPGVKKDGEKPTTTKTGRVAPRKTPTPPNTPGRTTPRPTKSNTNEKSSKNKTTQNGWTTKIVDNNSTILRSLPQGKVNFSSNDSFLVSRRSFVYT